MSRLEELVKLGKEINDDNLDNNRYNRVLYNIYNESLDFYCNKKDFDEVNKTYVSIKLFKLKDKVKKYNEKY